MPCVDRRGLFDAVAVPPDDIARSAAVQDIDARVIDAGGEALSGGMRAGTTSRSRTSIGFKNVRIERPTQARCGMS